MQGVRRSSVGLVLVLVAVSACNMHGSFGGSPASDRDGEASRTQPYEPDGASDTPAADCEVDEDKELLIIDRAVLQSAYARNDASDGALSFRAVMEALAGSPEDAYAMTTAWLGSWATIRAVGAEGASVTPRPAVNPRLLEPWAEVARNARAPMASAPFRLIAVVNRLDLREDPLGCSGSSGELRLVYTAVDPRTRSALPMTIIVELPLPSTRTARGWASAWHALGRQPLDSAFAAELSGLVGEVMVEESVRGARIRTNEAAFDDVWEMREFSLSNAKAPRTLEPNLLESTPRDELDRSVELRTWLVENSLSLEQGSVPMLPPSMQAGAATLSSSTFRWGTGVPIREEARRAFSEATCTGCHGGERGTDALRFQHLAPWDAPGAYYGSEGSASTRVSTYLRDPSGRDDELGRRAKDMASLLCATACTSSQGGTYRP